MNFVTMDEWTKDKLTILIGLIGGIKFRFVGTFYASEILIYILLYYASWDYIKANKYAWNIFKLGILWLFSAVVTDLWVGNDTINSLKGTFNVIFFFMQFPVIYWLLYDKPLRYLYYLVAVALVSLPNLYFFGPEFTDFISGSQGENIWFFYALSPIATASIGWFYYKQKIGVNISCILIIAFGVFMLFHGSRNIFLSMAMAAVLLYQIAKISQDEFADQVEYYKQHIVKLFIYMFVGIICVNFAYETLASSGTLGEQAYKKYLKQSASENMLEGGRSETFMGAWLIEQSPIIGYGSFAMDKNDSYHIKYAREHGNVYIPFPWERRMPAHSHLVGAWMENGIGGGIFWIYVLFLMWMILRSGAFLSIPLLLPAVLMEFTGNLWDIFFSPFGLRVPAAFFIMFLTILYYKFINKEYCLDEPDERESSISLNNNC